MRPSWQFMVGGTAVSLLFAATGALWALAPRRFVSFHRRFLSSGPLDKTPEWERATVSVSSRLIGVFWFLLGCMMLWTMYSPFIHSRLFRSP
jgi:hypothetical protein